MLTFALVVLTCSSSIASTVRVTHTLHTARGPSCSISPGVPDLADGGSAGQGNPIVACERAVAASSDRDRAGEGAGGVTGNTGSCGTGAASCTVNIQLAVQSIPGIKRRG
jgi:hypothetical protein